MVSGRVYSYVELRKDMNDTTQVEAFEYTGDFNDDGMDGWFELFDSDETDAWVATDNPVDLEDMA